jgi:hypothetical protein
MNKKISENDVGNSAAALANRKYPCFEKLGGSVLDDCCMYVWMIVYSKGKNVVTVPWSGDDGRLLCVLCRRVVSRKKSVDFSCVEFLVACALCVLCAFVLSLQIVPHTGLISITLKGGKGHVAS